MTDSKKLRALETRTREAALAAVTTLDFAPEGCFTTPDCEVKVSTDGYVMVQVWVTLRKAGDQ